MIEMLLKNTVICCIVIRIIILRIPNVSLMLNKYRGLYLRITYLLDDLMTFLL